MSEKKEIKPSMKREEEKKEVEQVKLEVKQKTEVETGISLKEVVALQTAGGCWTDLKLIGILLGK